MAIVHLLLGTNLGNKEENLHTAIGQIGRQTGEIITVSSIYRTAAWGKTDQPDFFNQVMVINTDLSPQELLSFIHEIEQNLGRIRAEKWGSRSMDIDILFWDDLIVNDSELIIPHPGIPQRKFTLVPLLEVSPDLIHPGLQKSIRQLLAECIDPLPVERV
ncbi:MAG: 2-amino-4-hydroxy-6-hydroxymethyldihydropteridine diphosphokinase [Cyclobacteriaceae bacterium]|nr:2-amino-4-hydroxy-6-hydroxymethyldihydropteridine diphosphokinase [Cyclobacteriaceae bacterium]